MDPQPEVDPEAPKTSGLLELERPQRLVERVEAALRDAIVSGELPAGTHLSVPEIARRMRVSRSPARDALFSLGRSGLVEIRPHRGAVVVGGAGVEKDLRDLFDVREALECIAARLAARRDGPATGEELHAILRDHREAILAGNVDEHVRLDVAFHQAVTAASGNYRLAELIGQLRDQIIVLVRASSTRPGGMDEAVLRAHGAIARAIARGDEALSESRMRDHLRAVLEFTRPT